MLSATILLLLNGIYLTLRISGSGSFPRPLTEKEEREYLLASASGDINARNMLIERNLRLVAHVIKKYYIASRDHEDLISIGTVGLIKAISTFDVSKGARLSTYAARCIENEILMHFRSIKKTVCEVSLSDPLDSEKETNNLALMDVICTDDYILDRLDAEEMNAKLHRQIAACLDERESRIITLRYGLGNGIPKTQKEIAGICRISRSYVSRIEKRALSKLEEGMKREDEAEKSRTRKYRKELRTGSA